MKVAVVSLGWPPLWGGGEIYPHRLVEALCSVGVDAVGITATPEIIGKDNGDAPVIRIINKEIMSVVESIDYGVKIIPCIREPQYAHLIGRWLNQVEKEIDTSDFDCAIIVSQTIPLTEDEGYIRIVEKLFPKYISLAYDFDANITVDLERDMMNNSGNYKETFEYFTDMLNQTEYNQLKQEVLSQPFMKCHANHGESGRLHITNFNQSVVECIGKEGNSFVFHPPLESTWWVDRKISSEKKQFTVGFINPIKRKGSMQLRVLIEQNPEIHFNILSGGWNEGTHSFMDYMALSAKVQNRDLPTNFNLIEYVQDIKGFYDSVDLFLFSSMSEGYGQVATEAIVRGIPVLCKEYPTIREATMDGALYIPAKDYLNYELWNDALHEMRDNYDYWFHKTVDTSHKLQQRQVEEAQALVKFLEKICFQEEK